MTSEAKSIIIDLTQDLLAETIEVSQLIHRQSVERLVDLVSKAFPGNTSPQAAGNKPRSANQVFFIDGTRGAGKSTFLAAVSKALPQKIPSLCALPVIDPTMIETGELHVLFSILFQVKAKVEENIKYCGSWDKTEPNYESWRKTLKKLARGANLLNGHKSTNPMDDLLSLEEGLESAQSGANLSALLKVFLTQSAGMLMQSAGMLKVEGFIIAFDDVDTNFDIGWKVLELIRRYLQCPQLVVLITGDLQLYTHLVRRQQYKNFGNELHKRDKSRKREREEMVDHLEQQYLLKLFPLQNRIHLDPLSILLEANNGYSYKCLIETEKEPIKLELKAVISTIIQCGLLIQQQPQKEIFEDFLLAQPVRSVVQILRRWYYQSKDVEVIKTDKSTAQEEDALHKLAEYLRTQEENAPNKLAESLRSIFMGSLFKLGIDVDALSQRRQGQLIEAVFDAVVQDGEYDTGIYLRPQPRNESVKNTYVALAAEVAAQCYKDPARAIRYFLVALGSVALLQKQKPSAATMDLRGDYVTNYKKTMSIGREEDALNWARYAAPILLSPYDESSTGVGPGVLKFSRWKIAENRVLNTLSEYWVDSCKNVPSEISELQKFALSVATHQVAAGEQIFEYASIFNLLGAIERLLAYSVKTDKPNKTDEAGKTDEAVKTDKLDKPLTYDVLIRLCAKVTVTAPDWLAGSVSDSNRQEIYSVSSETDIFTSSNIDSVLAPFIGWLSKVKSLGEKVMPSALFLGKVWPRLYFSLTKVAEHWVLKLDAQSTADKKESNAEKPNLGPYWVGYLMHLNVLSLLNAFLVEEHDYHYRHSEIKLPAIGRSNPVDSSKIFFDKLKGTSKTEMSLAEFDKCFPFTMLLMRCPLIAVFLVHETSGKDTPKVIRDLLAEIFQKQPKDAKDETADPKDIIKNLKAGLKAMDRILIGHQRVSSQSDSTDK